jgi:hypothetical protein
VGKDLFKIINDGKRRFSLSRPKILLPQFITEGACPIENQIAAWFLPHHKTGNFLSGVVGICRHLSTNLP